MLVSRYYSIANFLTLMGYASRGDSEPYPLRAILAFTTSVGWSPSKKTYLVRSLQMGPPFLHSTPDDPISLQHARYVSLMPERDNQTSKCIHVAN